VVVRGYALRCPMEGSSQTLERGYGRKTDRKLRQPSVQICASFLVTFVGRSQALHTRVRFVSRLLPSSPKPASHASPNPQSMPGAIIISIAYGIDIKSADDKFLSASLEAIRVIGVATTPGNFLVDVIPARECLCAQTVTPQAPDRPSDSTVHPRLVPWDEVQGSCQKRTRQVENIYQRSFGICQECHEGLSAK